MREKGEGKKGEAFTRIALSTNTLKAKGEEMKAKNEKQRTRVRAQGKLRCIAPRRRCVRPTRTATQRKAASCWPIREKTLTLYRARHPADADQHKRP